MWNLWLLSHMHSNPTFIWLVARDAACVNTRVTLCWIFNYNQSDPAINVYCTYSIMLVYKTLVYMLRELDHMVTWRQTTRLPKQMLKKLWTVRRAFFTQELKKNPTVSRAPRFVSPFQWMWNMASPSAPALRCWITARKVLLQNITVSRRI